MWPYIMSAGPWGFAVGTMMYAVADWQNTSQGMMAAGGTFRDGVHGLLNVPETDVPVLHEIAETADRDLEVVRNVVTLDVAQGIYAAVSGDDWCGFWDDCFYE
jgi:hypothetical protein